ncbi:MAG: Ribosomal small subunit methyltransferase [Candidatus Berkelbacteria bacterium]|nr:Ribosomal small subunit methyltransferase [Candidatus Berkelbacteria bacterium]
MKPKKRLGQNFLVNESILPIIITAAEIQSGETVLEIGPGTGILTKELLKAGAKVFAIEKDFDLIAGLTKKFGSNKNLKIVHQDALWFDETTLSEYKVVANLPFNVASPLIRKFLESSLQPQLMVLMVQKEVAEKIVAKPGNSERGILTLSVEFYGDAKIIATVLKNSFRPQPKVDAAVIKIKPYKVHPGSVLWRVEPKLFFRIVKAGFAAKRQQIHNSLAATLRLPKDQVKDLLTRSSIGPAKRAEDLTLEDWINLSKTFESSINS